MYENIIHSTIFMLFSNEKFNRNYLKSFLDKVFGKTKNPVVIPHISK